MYEEPPRTFEELVAPFPPAIRHRGPPGLRLGHNPTGTRRAQTVGLMRSRRMSKQAEKASVAYRLLRTNSTTRSATGGS